ncbi:MAG: hypothetical protein C0623_10505 [Desulfuromonas sp.]|nr:MAG: hypothetical protein C0623_10505 [Desulfuromonas sp.]
MGNSSQQEKNRILLIDDDLDFADSMTGLLELEGYPVATASTADEGVALLAEFQPAVALVDIRIGQQSGLDLVVRLHQSDPELTIVIVTAYADTETAIEALKRGVYDFLRKPFEASDLLAVLHRCTDRKRLLEEKKAAERARQESEGRFRIAFETSPDAIILAYPDGAIIDVNHGFEQMTGHRKEQVVGLNSLEIGLWRNSDDRKRMLEQLQGSGRVDNLESDFRMNDGRLRKGLMSARIVHIEDQPVGLFVVRDIHELRAKEQAIIESEERFRSVVSNIAGAVYRCRLDPERTLIFVSRPIEDISGYRSAEFVNNDVRSFVSIIHPDDLEMVRHEIALAMNNGESFSIDYRIVDREDNVRWVNERGRVKSLAGESDPVIDGILFDISESKKTVEQLVESKERLRTIYDEYNIVLDGIPDAILLINSDLKVVWGNKGAHVHFGFSRDELAGLRCSRIWNCAEAGSEAFLRKVFRDGSPYDAVQKTLDGKVCGVKVFPITAANGKVESVIQVASDMTEKMHLREQASRSAHLAALGELAAGVAHEINNPTGTILLNLPMLKDAFADLQPVLEKIEPDLDNMKIAGLPYQTFCQEVPVAIDETTDCARRIKRIVEELKDFSRPAAGEFGNLDLNEVVRTSISMVRNALKNTTDNFKEIYCAHAFACKGNSQRLGQVLVNLLLNACQSLPDRSCGIEVETRIDKATGECLVIVSDEGRGIPEELLTQITDPFFTTRRESGGTGLGLSVSSRIIDEHKGRLEFDSAVGKGTTVTIRLPVAAEGSGQ